MRRSRVRRPMEEPANRDRWMVSYADFITVLFAFFVVLFASSHRDGQAIKKLSRAIHTGFQQLGPFAGMQSEQGISPGRAEKCSSIHPSCSGNHSGEERGGGRVGDRHRRLAAGVGSSHRSRDPESGGDHAHHSGGICHQPEGAWLLQ